MKTIGLIGGTSWESTAIYYRLLNEGVRARMGGLHSASLVLVSVDFAPLAKAMAADQWGEVSASLVDAARQLETSGAGCVALCTNTMHKVAPTLTAGTTLPFLNIMDVVGGALARRGKTKPLLLATRYTMEQDFYRAHLRDRYDIDAAVPESAARDRLQAIIFDELCRGVVTPQSKEAVLAMVQAAGPEGCDAVIFGCTEIGLLLCQADLSLPVFDTTTLHCEALLDFAFDTLPLAMSPAA